ncbi:TrmH family RNA methyltransferase [Sulfurovum mangrovi]|uniref:TrmH family RNA methyltransferase n=1 Tax=Sulfurovum mangrovi TaxID=2893889 RepID=UPI001E3E1B58|nr:TrmH family RNA methyltransferase [Sulfurovum mangrovi]UFH60444.1 tRNA (guanine-N2)-dimethyltransferase [Sulfurovum mangrovi]
MREMSNQKRISRIEEILRHKQPDLQVILDDVNSSQNLSAIIRSCDGAGVLHLYYAAGCNDTLKVHKTITQGAHRWLRRKHIATEEKVTFLEEKKAEGYQVVVTHLDENAVSFREIDYTKPTLLVMGNEKEGVSKEVLALADHKIIIPMQGMVQSLNVSVATALILYEAQRQREDKGMYETAQLDSEEQEQIKEEWLYRDIIARRSKGKIKLPGE